MVTWSECSVKVCTQRRIPASHTLTFLSLELVAKCVLSGQKSTQSTYEPCPLSVPKIVYSEDISSVYFTL